MAKRVAIAKGEGFYNLHVDFLCPASETDAQIVGQSALVVRRLASR